jgi:hypothetical protein
MTQGVNPRGHHARSTARHPYCPAAGLPALPGIPQSGHPVQTSPDPLRKVLTGGKRGGNHAIHVQDALSAVRRKGDAQVGVTAGLAYDIDRRRLSGARCGPKVPRLRRLPCDSARYRRGRAWARTLTVWVILAPRCPNSLDPRDARTPASGMWRLRTLRVRRHTSAAPVCGRTRAGGYAPASPKPAAPPGGPQGPPPPRPLYGNGGQSPAACTPRGGSSDAAC